MVKDRFSSNDRTPLFLSGPAEEPKQSGIRKAVSSDILRKAVLGFGAAAVVFAAVSVKNLVLFASVTASQVDTPAPQDNSSHSIPAIQSRARAEALPGTAPGEELLAAFKSAFESETEVDQPRAEALFNQFQAWAAEEDTQEQVRPPQPVQGAQAQGVEKAWALPLPKPRPIQAAQTARAQDRPPENPQWLARGFGWRN
jgi:hypothetical protein